MSLSFIRNPHNIRFEGQDPDEKILLVLRAHPITTLSWIIPAVGIFFLPFLLPRITNFLDLSFLELPLSFILVFLVINYILVLVIVFEGFLHWYFNVYIVTNKNLVDVDFHSILFKNIDLAPIRNVEDTSSSMGGILRSIFNYGDVFVQTAGTTKNIDFHAVPDPHTVSDFILDLTHKLHEGGT